MLSVLSFQCRPFGDPRASTLLHVEVFQKRALCSVFIPVASAVLVQWLTAPSMKKSIHIAGAKVFNIVKVICPGDERGNL